MRVLIGFVATNEQNRQEVQQEGLVNPHSHFFKNTVELPTVDALFDIGFNLNSP